MTKHGVNIITHHWISLLSSSNVAATITPALNAMRNLSIIGHKYGRKRNGTHMLFYVECAKKS